MEISYDKNVRGVYIVTTSSSPLMVRASPSTDGTVMAEMPKSSKCVCLGCYSGDWYCVTYEHDGIITNGFSNKKYLRKDYSI